MSNLLCEGRDLGYNALIMTHSCKQLVLKHPDDVSGARRLGAEGEFPDFYTGTVGNVFFEVVERRGGHDESKAPNAPVRPAAQFVYSTDKNHT